MALFSEFQLGLITGLGLSAMVSLFFTLRQNRTRVILHRLRKLREKGRLKSSPMGAPPDVEDWRMVLVVNSGLNMQKGKVASQCAHAAVDVYIKSLLKDPTKVNQWQELGCTKIVCRAENDSKLEELKNLAKSKGLVASLVRDSGQTQIAPGSKTVLGIGPDRQSLLSEVTGGLRLF
ncbi:peptidyl-tRNA hydrolase 2, mitochondrial-like [Brevipalpus obovatus]|uniref:peptidyl-tRNA hydrolase 2, mitochondrial-like n=1 Tax=Brevipalpus obovatus TaxID=246614 RepID=UPI003D9DDAFE